MRTMDGLLLAWSAGIILVAVSGGLPDQLMFGSVVAAVLLILYFIARVFPALKKRLSYCAGLLSVFSVAVYTISLLAQHHQQQMLPSYLENRSLQINGFVCSLPQVKAYFTAYEFCQSSISDSGSVDISNSNFSGKVRLYAPKTLAPLRPGDSYKLKVRLKKPHGSVNPAGFIYEKYLFRQQIMATGSLIWASEALPPVQQTILDALHRAYWQFRGRLANLARSRLQGLSHAELMMALSLGDKSGLSGATKQILVDTGTQHLVAISGLHIGAIIYLVLMLCGQSGKASIAAILIALGYALLAGFPVSSQRALIMAAMLLWQWRTRTQMLPFRAWLTSLSLVLLWDPLSALDSGFWFSFLAVLVLLLRLKAGTGRPDTFLNILQSQIWVILATGLIIIWHGFEVNTSSLVANMFAIPWVSLVILPILILAWILSVITSLSGNDLLDSFVNLLFGITDFSLDFLLEFLGSLATLSFSHPFKLSWLLLIAIVVMSVFLLVVSGRLRIIAMTAALILGGVFIVGKGGEEQGAELLVFDVGQGLSVMMRRHSTFWLYDTGPAGDGWTAIERAVFPYFNKMGMSRRFDGIVVSHGDKDHAGGTPVLLKRARSSLWWSGQPRRVAERGPFVSCVRGMVWQQDSRFPRKFKVEVLYPETDTRFTDSNSHSCVIRVTLNGVDIIMTGDLGGTAERAFLNSYRDDLKADILIAGHHGAATSTSYALLKRVRPDWVIYSAGYFNAFGHPSHQVKRRVKVIGATGLNTAETGAIRIRVDDWVHESSAEKARSKNGSKIKPKSNLHIEFARELLNDFWLQSRN